MSSAFAPRFYRGAADKRREIGEITGDGLLEQWRSPGETVSAIKNTDKPGTNQLVRFPSATTKYYHPQDGSHCPLPFRNPGQPHAFIAALAFGEVTRIVAVWASAEATDGEIWLERQSGLRGSARFIQLPKQC